MALVVAQRPTRSVTGQSQDKETLAAFTAGRVDTAFVSLESCLPHAVPTHRTLRPARIRWHRWRAYQHFKEELRINHSAADWPTMEHKLYVRFCPCVYLKSCHHYRCLKGPHLSISSSMKSLAPRSTMVQDACVLVPLKKINSPSPTRCSETCHSTCVRRRKVAGK